MIARRAPLIIALGCLLFAPSLPCAEDEPVGLRVHAGLPAARLAAVEREALILLAFVGGTDHAGMQTLLDAVADAGFRARQDGLHVAVLTTELEPDTAARFQVRTVPDLLVLDADGVIYARRSGALPSAPLADWIDLAADRRAHGSWWGQSTDQDPESVRTYSKAIAGLGDRQPVERTRCSTLLLRLGERSMPHLIAALDDGYLGVRIGVHEVLGELAPDAPPYDPWAAAEQRRAAAVACATWWEGADGLGERATMAEDGAAARARRAALSDIGDADDPLSRTRAMTALYLLGDDVLGTLAAARDVAIADGDHVTMRLIDTVRWAILIPGSLERRLGLRRTLIAGTSDARQQAVEQLAAAGKAALPALRALIADDDELVREAAIHALRGVGGPAALEAIASMLAAEDSNLRAVAAQSLGKSKQASAGALLVSALDDADEVVAITAIAALEEIKAKDQAPALIGCLDDERWRVRAEAAEALGQLEITTAADQLQALLADEDAYVVRKALVALREIKSVPASDALLALVERLPDLTGLCAELLARKGSAASVELIGTIYARSDPVRQAGIFAALSELGATAAEHVAVWRKLVDTAKRNESAEVRARLADWLAVRRVALGRPVIAELAADDEPDVRRAARWLMLRAALHHWGGTGEEADDYRVRRHGKNDFGVLLPQSDRGQKDIEPPAARAEAYARLKASPALTRPAATAEDKPSVAAIRELHRGWHRLLVEQQAQTPLALLARWFSGPGLVEIDLLEQAVAHEDFGQVLEQRDAQMILRGMLRRLPWPAGRQALDAVRAQPGRYAQLLELGASAAAPVREVLLDAGSLVAAIAAAGDDAYGSFASALLQRGDDALIDLRGSSPTAVGLRRDLWAAEAPAARRLAAYAYARSGDARSAAVCRAAIADPDPWTVWAAIPGLVHEQMAEAEREACLAPLLEHEHLPVATTAAILLLDEAIREQADLDDHLRRFHHPGGSTWISYHHYGRSNDDFVFRASTRRPGWLAVLIGRTLPKEHSWRETWLRATALLRAQFGDAAGLHELLERWHESNDRQVAKTLLLGLRMTGDTSLLPVVRAQIEHADASWDLRRVLQSLVGLPGDEARSLRREINERMRRMR